MFKDSTSKRLRLMLLLVLLAFIFCGSQSAFGMPPHPDLKKQFKEKKKPIPAFIRNPEILRQRGIDNPAPRPGLRQRILQDEPAQGPSGSFRALALLVDFSDRTSQVSASYFDTLIFASTGSTVRSYYNEVSYGTLTIVTVNLPSTTGWLRAPQTYSYYVNGQNGLGTYPQNAQKLVEDAVDAANSVVNYSLYDNDANGYVDALFVVHAGPGAEYTGSFNDIWSHQWSISPRLRDGVYISTYSMEPEYWLSPNDMTSGVFCHELGHVFGLPDLYDTDDSSEGIGNWSLMAGGSWNGVRGNSPAHLDAWSRIYLDFASTTLVSADSIGLSITAVETTPQIYYLWDCDPTSDEYFLLENRQPVGFDAALPGSGLLIWHIDEGMTTNRNECLDHQNCNCVSHYKVALEQADGALDLEYGLDRGDSGDPFPGSTNKRAFDLSTTPNPGSYASCDSNIEISNISNSASTMTVDVHTCTAPNGLFFPYLEFPVASKPVAVAIGDVNNDARNDVVVTTTYENDPANDHRIHVFLQDASGSLQTPAVKYLIDPAFFTYHSQSVDIGDLNNDGRSDVVVSAQDSVGVFHQNGAGTLEPMVSYPCGHSSIRNAYQVRIGDFNNDGLLDVVSIDEGFESNDADVFLQNAGGTLDEPVTYVVEHGGYDDLDVGDVNGDGLQDIIVMSGYGGYSTLGILLQNASGTLDPAVYYDLPVAANARGVAVGDIDGDTLDDVAVTYGVPTEYVGVFYQNITGTLDPAISYPTMNVSDAVETEDLDNDLLNDIVVAHSAWVYLGVYRHDVAGELLPEEYYPIPAANGTSPHGMAIGDLNSDGGNDVAIVSDLSGLTVLYNTSPVSPTIALSTFALSSSTPLLQNAPSQTFEVWNSGAGTLSYTVSWNVGFFSCVPITGTSTGEHDTITVNYNSANLSAGTYSGTITITDSNALNNPQTILVTLTILQSTIARSPTSLTNTCSVGYNAPNQSFEVWNSGGATLSYTISDNVTWLACAPTTGTSTGEHDTITVTYSTSALARGTYTGTITIMSDSAASNSPQTIPVTLTVVSPTIARSPTTLTNTCLLATNASSQTFDVWNSGAGILSYSISDNADWLSCSPASGTSLTNEHDTIAVNYATASLPVGTHSATITISDPNATNNPLTISVNLTVWKPTITLSTNALSKTVRMGLNASNQTFQVRNSGTGTLSYTISDNADWLACTPASGTSTTENDTISVVYTTYALAVGNYSATITVADANASNNPQTISVSLEVVQPTISRNPTTIAAACAPGENAVSQSFEVWNTGVGTLSYTITDNSTWMSCSPTSGASLGEHDTITITYDTSALAVGKYTGTITISDPNATNTPQTIVVTLTVGPTISRNPTTLTNNSQTGQDAAAQSFEVWNSGMGTLAYTITSDVAWLTCNPVSGTSTGEHDTLAVSYGTAALLRGTYRATITISSASATNTPQTIPVTLTVIQPTIARSPTTLTNTCLLATNAASQTFDVWNSGSGTLSYAISDNADWLSCSPASGTSLTNEHDVITVSYATASLPVGAHSAIITISDPNSTNSPQTISVNLTVWKPTITLSTSALSKTVRMGLNASNQTFQVRNSGTGTLSYTISDNADWLACTPASGTSTTENDTISVVYTTYALAVGNYSATITVADANASNNPQTISVSLEVVQPTISRNPTTLTAACAPGENAVSQSFEVWNTGVGTLSYTITDNSTWLSCSPTSGASLGEHDTITITYDTSALAVGKYTGTITISDPNATNTPQTVVVTLTVGPTISRNPTTLTNNSQTGQDAAAQSFEVWNSGMGTLAYTITSDAAWLTCNPVSGISTGEHDTIAVSYSTAALLRGTYRATITISSASATNTPQTIPVTLTVIQPTIARSPTTLTNTCLLATNAASQTFDVWNSGSGTLSYTISDDVGWLTCSPATGTSLTNEHDVITVSYATASLPVGAHSATITISDPNSTNSPQTISVNLTVWKPTITLSTSALSKTVRMGLNASNQTFQVRNSGTGTLSYTISDNADWLACTPASGTSTTENDTISIVYTTYALAVGNYSATITVADANASNNPQTISVSLEVVQPTISRSPTTLTAACAPGENAVSQSFEIWNTGVGTLSYTITDNAAWLSCSPSNGASLGEHDTITITYDTSALAVGKYTGTITISDPNASNTPQTVVVTLTVGATISRSPTTLTNNSQTGQDAAAQSFEVWNSGMGTLAYTIASNVAWLTCSPSSETSNGEHDTIAVNYSTAGLTRGTYLATITISSVSATNTPQTIPVTLTVVQPTIARSPTTLTNTCLLATNAASQTFDVWNSGAGTLSYAISDNADWLSCSPASGTSLTNEHDTITVNYATASLPVGAHSAIITISDPNSTNSPQTISVNLTVWKPTITLSTNALSKTVRMGLNASNQTFQVRNSGTGTLSYTISDNADWLTCTPASGTSTTENDTISIVYTTYALAVGNYSATITVADANASNNPQTISVSLEVVEPTISRSPTTLAGACAPGENAVSQSFEVWNAGVGTLSYTITDNATWMSCSPTSGASLGEHDTITITYDTSALAVGKYTGTITISDPNATNTPQTIVVTLTVGPTISRNPTTLTNNSQTGQDAAAQSFEVWNSGMGTLAYTITSDAAWLTCNPVSGTSTGEHDTIAVSYGTAALLRGTYRATITISSASATNTPQTIPVTLTVIQPTIARSPTTLTNTCLLATNAASQTFDVWNSGSGTLSYAISDSADWLSCSPASGTSLTNEHDVITVSYATASLPVGAHSAIITISDPNSTNSPQTISVNLTVWKPTITLSTSALSRTVRWGLNATSQTFQVRNSGTGTLSYTISDNADWLACTPASGTSTTENDTISVVYTTYALAVGNYSATITVTDANATNSPQTISVSLGVVLPTIARSPTTLVPACVRGQNAASQSFEVWNTGYGILSYTITDNAAWLSCSPVSGDSLGEHDTINVTYITSALAPGRYTGVIFIKDVNATNTPQYIIVTLTVY